MIFTQLIVSIIVSTLTFWVWRHRIEIKLSWQMPGSFPYVPLLGIAWRFFIQENLEALTSYLKPYENIESPIGMWIGTKFLIFVDNPRDIETILTSPNVVRDKMYKYIKDTIGVDGLFTSEGEISRKHRRLVSPSFSEKVVMSYVTIFGRLSSDLVESFKQMVNKEPFDIRPYISDCTIDAFFEAIFSLDVDSDTRLCIHRNMKMGQSLIGKRFFLPWYQSEWIWKLSGHSKLSHKVAIECEQRMDKIVQKVIGNGSSDITFLERMIRVSEENDDFTIKDVKAEAMTGLIAGSDTSSASIAYTILLLAMHPEHQERVFDELKAILPSKSTPLSSQHIAKMEYLELCIKESLRLFPVVSLMSKMVDKGSINLSGHEIHPGISLVIGVNRVHRKLKYWGLDANKFVPTRFLPEYFSKVNRFAYLPFSGGARNCLGYKYAYIAMKSILANILRNYRITTPLKLDDLKVRMTVNIVLLNKHMVQIHERNE